LIAYTAHAIALRRVARPFGARWYSGLTDPLGLHDLAWLNASGEPLNDFDWHDSTSRLFGCLIGEPGRAAAPLLLLVNADAQDGSFMLPAGVWEVILDTTHPRGLGSWHGQGEAALPLPAGSLLLLAAAGADVRL
jgi:glycogen operon protein